MRQLPVARLVFVVVFGTPNLADLPLVAISLFRGRTVGVSSERVLQTTKEARNV